MKTTKPCPAALRGECFHGCTAGRYYLHEVVHLLVLASWDAKRNRDRPHPQVREISPTFEGRQISASSDLVELTEALAGRPMTVFGHDAIDRYEIVDKIITAAGLDDESWGICSVCGGRCEIEVEGE